MGTGDKRGVPQPTWAPAAIANIHTIKFGGGDGAGTGREHVSPSKPFCQGWSGMMGGGSRASGRILQYTAANALQSASE